MASQGSRSSQCALKVPACRGQFKTSALLEGHNKGCLKYQQQKAGIKYWPPQSLNKTRTCQLFGAP